LTAACALALGVFAAPASAVIKNGQYKGRQIGTAEGTVTFSVGKDDMGQKRVFNFYADNFALTCNGSPNTGGGYYLGPPMAIANREFEGTFKEGDPNGDGPGTLHRVSGTFTDTTHAEGTFRFVSNPGGDRCDTGRVAYKVHWVDSEL
jgi:hypothetical protein